MSSKPWVSFCISTYKRPGLLAKQLALLAGQTERDFEVVISDNDPEGSAEKVVAELLDQRFKYWNNGVDLGMIRSFNRSIDRATTEYIVMVTDDDPVDPEFLATFKPIIQANKGYSIYCGFARKGKEKSEVEVIGGSNFFDEILDPDKTPNLLWSSAIVSREDALRTGLIPDYGSPHLADHAFLAKVGSVRGGIVMNKMFSNLSSHKSNFSKSNLSYYVSGCQGFYEAMTEDSTLTGRNHKAIMKHLRKWFIANFFNLRKYFFVTEYNMEKIDELDRAARQILEYPPMKPFRLHYLVKKAIFYIKLRIRVL
jgi:glycosyltransferase involved in cell wall biosynthesis